MAQIIVLDQNMVNMIAAGEVIERPASVVKELMENSIDAGAARITVAVEDGGRKLLWVTDDGCGMDADDLANAFEPHATSKIRTSSDLRNISTLGFRGEALASIASVAQVRAVSRTKDSTAGNCLEIDCGNKGDLAPCSADSGTTIRVRDLFYKLPVRRKFLKTANTEVGHITEHFTRVALAKSDLDLTLIHNTRELYRLPAGQGLLQRIGQLFSSEIAENLIQTESSEKGLDVFALMGRPDIARTNKNFQYVFVNGRFIRDKFISHAIKEAYRGTLPPDRFGVIFLFIRMPCEDVDVNVHPTKIEVRFCNANLVHSQILGCLRERLLATNLDTPAKLPLPAGISAEPKADLSTQARKEKITEAMAEFLKKHRPGPAAHQFERSAARDQRPYQPATQATEYDSTTLQKKFMQIHDAFIIAQTDDGCVIIDQHALHERIMYESLCRRVSAGKLESQRLLIPESFELTDAQAAAIETNSNLIERLGIELAPFGPRTMAIQAFPTLLSKAAPLDFVRDMLDLLSEKGPALDAEALLDELLNMAACRAAVKAGQRLSDPEIEHLLAERQTFDSAGHCPHGRPTTIKFSLRELEKQFRRT
ncbi:MAG: DNA mismatch repair endonuclease MutL [Planctomycetota bacterium]|jgi:DNA mismatch repair protein MutL